VFIVVVYFVVDSVRKLLDTPSYQFALLFNVDQFPLKFTKNPFVFTVTS